jgi:4-amino-4-deoxy-L-arabinose transferase-like glycosyltransferase
MARGARLHAAIVATVLLIYAGGAATLSWVRMPQSDEGHFANAGYELAYDGRLAMPMRTEWVASLDRHMYVQMPLYYVQLAPWIKAFGFDLRTIRLNSVLWGIIFAMAWYVIVRAVSRDRTTALLGLALIGLHYDVMNLTSVRYDPMCAALGTAGVACYLAMRERRLATAVLAANACLAAALLTHPFGVFGVIGFLTFFALLDLRRVSVPVVLAAVVPYAIAFGAWGVYILQDPAAFKNQITANAQGRVADVSRPLTLLATELRQRYLERYAGWRPDVPPLMRIKIVFLLAYLAGVLGCLASLRLRRERAVVALVVWAGLSFGALMVLDSNRWYVYLLHVIPIFVAVLAVWLGALWARGPLARYAVQVALAVWILFSMGTVALRARLNDYDRLYAPTLAYLQGHVRDGDLVMAPAEFGPGLGFAPRVLDDPKFGYRNGRTPDWIVHDKLQDEWMAEWGTTNPALHRHVQETLERYQLVLDNRQPYNYYRVYHRRSD